MADHYSEVIAELDRKPAVIGHSFGGLLTMIVAGRGLAAASVAIDSAPFRGVLPLPFSALKASAPVLGNPLNRHRAIPWTEAKADFRNPGRGPLLIIEGIGDNASPPAINRAAFKLQSEKRNAVTEIASIENRGHSITIDSGWREVCDTALTFIKRVA